MKNLMSAIVFFCVLNINAQNYLITFAGTGGSPAVDTVKVENLTTGVTSALNGGDILRLTLTTGVNPIENTQSTEMKIYPNPMIDNSTVEIYPPVAGDAIITVHELTGIPVTQIHSYLENSRQEFRLSGLKKGFYLINIKGKNYQFSGRLLSNGKSIGTAVIEKVSNNIPAVEEKKLSIQPKRTMSTIDMQYSSGERLKFTGISGIYSTVMTDIPSSDKTITFTFIACSDGDGNNYPVVKIGTQIWMAENLKTTKFKDGTTSIPNVTGSTSWGFLTKPAYCWYNNDEAAYKTTYGALYNWYTVSTGNLCPAGWHVPTDADWTILTTDLGGTGIAGGKLKETGTIHWANINTGATNETGFTARPGGGRVDFHYNGAFLYFGERCLWWSSTDGGTLGPWFLEIHDNESITWRDNMFKGIGCSIRCIRD